ncbi:polysaccharide biosynthesis C-terminal domain-containing protein [Vibrio splendidus]|uniref:oligosaccharide flippase family protein n=1 Tax=Vibrio splendidus TaxID=29497 RepID=UPI000C825E14|nr:polysaccharide biosynthesis C-terminal domain-containing protein [Vibrio splendidus]PMP47834.1 hypothetical protein BCS86_04945 [Vibrio splendidus]
MSLSIGKDKAIIIILQGVSALVMILYGKLIAVNFTPEQYGSYTLQFAVYIFFNSFFISPTLQYVKTKNNRLNNKHGFKVYQYIIFIASIIVTALTGLFLWNKYNEINVSFVILIMIFCMHDAFFKMALDKINTDGRVVAYSLISFANKLLLLFFAFMLLELSEDFDSEYIWGGLMLSSIFTYLLCILANNKHKNRVVKKITITMHSKHMFRYSLPLALMSVWSWITNYFDRFVIEYYMNFSDLGLYNAAYGLGSKFFSLLVPVYLIILTPFIYGKSKTNLKKEKIVKSVYSYILIGFILILIVHLTYDFIGYVFLSKQYADGFFVISGMNIAYFFLTISYLYELLLYSESKTKLILNINIFSALSNIFLNVLFIPIYGLQGAIIATIISFLIKLILTVFYFNKL